MPLPPVNGVTRAAVFLKNEVTELADGDYKFLSTKQNSVFNTLIDTGVFHVVASGAEPVKSKLEIAIEKLTAKKESKGLTEKETLRLEKWLKEFETVQRQQGK